MIPFFYTAHLVVSLYGLTLWRVMLDNWFENFNMWPLCCAVSRHNQATAVKREERKGRTSKGELAGVQCLKTLCH